MKLHASLALAVALFLLGIVLGKTLFPQQASVCGQAFAYINPKLNCGSRQVISKANPIDLKAKLNAFIENEKKVGRVEEIAVYFRDLQDGPILGINENEEFISASLLKLPIAMTIFRIVEDNEVSTGLLTRRLKYEENTNNEDRLIQFYQPANTIQPRTFYSIEELVYHSLVYSDNQANDVLRKALVSLAPDRNLILQTYHELGLLSLAQVNQVDISTRSYSSLFRILYNASYLSAEHSEKILSMLAQSTFDEGIAAGVSKDIKVANKFGERFLGQNKQLHDCGIVYYPQNAYLLCVMTRGKNFSTLANIIRQISTMVYKDVESKRLP